MLKEEDLKINKRICSCDGSRPRLLSRTNSKNLCSVYEEIIKINPDTN
jgi:hypothetical protein